MRLGYLGPSRVIAGTGAEIRVPAGRHRVLLAALALRVNQIVPVGELADLLWDGCPPAGAARTIRVYVARLRAVLGPEAATYLLTRGPGYLWQSDADRIDTEAFARLCREGRATLRRGEWALAADQLGSALRLWRGAPLADVPSEQLRDRAVPGLERLRADAVEDRITADLHLGRHREVVAELRELLAVEPMREPLYGLLMRALYRDGRQAEALAAYRDARRVLVAELGTDPGPALRQLQQQILDGDPRLAMSAGLPPTPIAPAQLPRDITDFVGREAVVAALAGALRPGPGPSAPVAVVGMGGIGKTTLAVRVGHLVRDRYPDGALFVDLDGASATPLPVADALTRLLRSLGVGDRDIPVDLAERSTLLRTATAGRRLLVVLDNAAGAGQVRPLIPGSSTCGVVITSRDDLAGLAGVHRAQLAPLPPGEARRLLDQVAGAERLAADEPATDDLLAACAGLPLALRIVGARLATHPGHRARDLADALATPAPLAELTAGDVAVRASFDAGLDALRAGEAAQRAAAQAFLLLGGWPGDDLDRYAGGALLEAAPAAAGALLEHLVRVHLLQSPHQGRYRLHDLLRSFARERSREEIPADQMQAATARLADWYVCTMDRAVAAFAPYFRRLPLTGDGPAEPAFPDGAAALAWCDRERVNLVAVTLAAAGAGVHHQAWMLGTLTMPYWEQRMLWPEWAATHTAARDAARAAGDLVGEGRALTGLAAACRRSGDLRGALEHAAESLAVHRRLGDHERVLGLLDTQAMTHHDLGEPDQAARLLEEIVSDERADAFRRSTSLLHLGMVQADRRRPAESVALLEQALQVARSAGLAHCEVAALNSLGDAHVLQGRPDAALEPLRRCIELSGMLDDRIHEAEAEHSLGLAHAARGDPTEAVAHLTAAVRLMAELNHPDETAARRDLAAHHTTGQGR